MLSCPYNVSYLSRRAVVVRGPGELRSAMRWSRRWRHSWSWHVEWPGLLPAGLSHCCASPLAVQSTTAVWAECWRQCRVRKLSVNDRPSNLPERMQSGLGISHFPSTARHPKRCCRVGEVARDADAQLGASRRAKHAMQDFKRLAPFWKRDLQRRANTRTGRVALWGLFIWSITSGLFWKVRHPLPQTALQCISVLVRHVRRGDAQRAQHTQGTMQRSRPGQLCAGRLLSAVLDLSRARGPASLNAHHRRITNWHALQVLDTFFHITMFWFTVPLLLLPFLRMRQRQQSQQQQQQQPGPQPGRRGSNRQGGQSGSQYSGPTYDAEWASVDS